MKDRPGKDVGKMNRRGFLRITGTAATAAGLLPGVAQFVVGQAQAQSAAALVEGKDARLIVRNPNPVDVETPLALLRENRYTPKNYMYIRNNQGMPGFLTTQPPKVDDWTVEVVGLVDKPITLQLSQLKTLPATEVEMVMQCSGNGRAFFSRFARASGSQWERGSLANVVWKGVKLSSVLAAAGIKTEARFLSAEGADQPATAQASDVERSIPLTDVLATALLAYEMNGEPLAAVHGGPLRLVIPGYYGINNIKWVNRLRLEAAPSTNATMVPRYRVPNAPIAVGSTFTFNQDNSRPNWRQNVKSVIFHPMEGDTVPASFEVRGAAWNDGSAPLTGVEVSIDGGTTWTAATLDKPSGPYGWSPWRVAVQMKEGQGEVWARATDALGRTQPIDGAIFWNPNGYEWNAVEKVKVKLG